jgi:D-alanyl-D-alanine carboxypeptidase (penicillin-binding protein 5/6)
MFKNVHGLDEEGHFSSSHDMAFIARELIKHETILKYSSIYEDYIKHPNGVNTWVVNTNKLINYYDGLDGLKTGYTKNSGYCITATAKRNNLRLISVVMGESSNKVRNEDTINLLNYGFSNYRVEKVIDDSKLGDIDILFGKKNKVKLKLIDSGFHLVKNGDKYNYSYEIIKDKIKAPVKVGDVVGRVNIYSNSVKIDTLELTIFEEVKRANFFDLYGDNLRLLLKGYK